jgi:hypothetical protein
VTLPAPEGQNDLRITAKAGTHGSPPGSFTGNGYSIGPFSYRILRVSENLSDKAAQFVLQMRERVLSWDDYLSTIYVNDTYDDFQAGD